MVDSCRGHGDSPRVPFQILDWSENHLWRLGVCGCLQKWNKKSEMSPLCVILLFQWHFVFIGPGCHNWRNLKERFAKVTS